MLATLKQSSTVIWLALMLATALSWWLGAGSALAAERSRAATVALLCTAFFKVHLIIDHFMEVRTAPTPLRVILNVWLIVVLGAVLGLYLFGFV